MELVLKHRMLGRVKEQLKHFLVGFYEVIPEALLTIFDFQELELLMCGLPTISLEDWKKNTDYAGELERKGDLHKVAQWFWSVLEEFEDDQKARLLQFVTGTSGVPSQVHSVYTKHIARGYAFMLQHLCVRMTRCCSMFIRRCALHLYIDRAPCSRSYRE
jgi:HECT-domain (ubiquitin-transferase)